MIKLNTIEHNREQYTQYLEDQLEKLSSFMLHQKKQNQKYNHLYELIQEQNNKIRFLNDKILLFELYQNQNLKNQQKLTKQFQKATSLQKRVNKLQLSHISNDKLQKKERRKEYGGHDNHLIQVVQQKIEGVRQQFLHEISYIDKNLTKKLNVLINNSEISTGNYTLKGKKTKNETQNNMSPLETNYSQNNKSRINEFDKNIPISQREFNHNSQIVSEFSNQRKISTVQRQSAKTYCNKASQIKTELNDGSIFNYKQRSPISQYLKKQQQYNSNQEKAELKDHSMRTKHFYSNCEIKRQKKQKIKSKKSKSKSRSRSKSEKSVLNNTRSNTNDVKKRTTKVLKSKRQEINQSKISKISQRSMSQLSEKSRSRSKSAQKMSKKQKKYLMCCKKEH